MKTAAPREPTFGPSDMARPSMLTTKNAVFFLHPEYTIGDITLASSDDEGFKVASDTLQAKSEVFRDILDNHTPGDRAEIVLPETTEDALEIFVCALHDKRLEGKSWTDTKKAVDLCRVFECHLMALRIFQAGVHDFKAKDLSDAFLLAAELGDCVSARAILQRGGEIYITTNKKLLGRMREVALWSPTLWTPAYVERLPSLWVWAIGIAAGRAENELNRRIIGKRLYWRTFADEFHQAISGTGRT